MHKFSLILLSIFLAFAAAAQQVENGVPENAYAVATVNSKYFFDLISISEFNQSKIGQALLEKVGKNNNIRYQSVEDFGIDLHGQVYIYSTKTDSIVYYGMCVPLNDAKKLDTLLRGLGTPLNTQNGLRRIELEDKKQIVTWNDKILHLFSGNLQDRFFENEQVAMKYGIKNRKLSDTYDTTVTSPEPPMTDTIDSYWNKADTVAESLDSTDVVMQEDEYNDYSSDHYTDSVNQDSIYDDYYASIAADDSIKSALLNKWLNNEVNRLSITKVTFENKSFKHAVNKKALASVWIRNVDELYNDFLSTVYSAVLGTKTNKFNAGFGSANAHLVVEGNHVKLSGALEVADDQVKRYHRIYNRKMNKKFFKYINEDALAYMGYKVNTQAYLEELPNLMKQYYGSLLGGFKEEIDLGATLFSLVLDEKAIGKVVKGDGVLILNGLKKQEVKYTTYEYDDDYNSIEVEKMKKETLPDFLWMFSSDDTKLMEKLLSIGLSKHAITEESGVYTFKNKKSPFDVHILLKDGIVFIGTSFESLVAVQQGKSKNNLSAKNKAVLKKNSMVLALNASKISKAVNTLDLSDSYGSKALKERLQNLGDFYFTSKGMDGNKMVAEFSGEFPSTHKNALKYILFLIENTAFGGM
ncbi:hypothetical protein [Olivibacter domesticus]|uniref:DUF4836 family protein n=1 Tax=Olivibacter domesticus TaxID=407022 RepID=A0A1H7QND6_OLID1|nr:hypothetical protein [Olivibacter domesticus]SEL49125.1 hypothetical protein SAMN05661044_02652 [Olivibacter domesticus]